MPVEYILIDIQKNLLRSYINRVLADYRGNVQQECVDQGAAAVGERRRGHAFCIGATGRRFSRVGQDQRLGHNHRSQAQRSGNTWGLVFCRQLNVADNNPT